jgi:hypothetical protein
MIIMQKKFLPHIIALTALFIFNAIYFIPAYQGKVLEQDDIKLGVAKSKELLDFREETGKQALWTNAMFSGMPTFQINLQHPGSIFEKLEPLTKLWQPAQIGLILFLMFGMYFLLASFRLDPWVSALGALAFGFSAFFIISFDAGHNAKLRAAGYMAPMLMGILLTFRGKRWPGLASTALFAGLAISANHIQITYYSVLIALVIAIVELIRAYRNSEIKTYLTSVGVLLIAALLAIGPNVSKLWTTYEYTQSTIRGGGSGLKAENEGGNGGLDKNYAFRWSYGPLETLNLVIPNLMGGGASQSYEGTETHEQLFGNIRNNLLQQGYGARQAESQAERQIASLFYWGDQSMVNGAYYLGASIFFLFVMGMFLIKDYRRTWIIMSIILAVLMGWGRHFSTFNDLLFNYLPLYNKFRVPSMTLIIVFLLMPLMGMFALDYVIKNYDKDKAMIQKALLNSFYIVGGLFIVIAILGPGLFVFEGANDERLAQNPQLLDLLVEDRKDLARSSAFRSLMFAGLSFLAIFLFLQKRVNKVLMMLIISALVVIDLWSFDKQHLNNDDFLKPSVYDASFNQTTADKSILQDDGYFRVFNLNNPFNDALTSYYHKAIGGYHGAKLQRYQELYENVLFKEQNRIIRQLQERKGQNMTGVFSSTSVLNMLNGKYLIYDSQAPAIQNPMANGAAWFVQNIRQVENAREMLDQLATISSANTVLVHKDNSDYLQNGSVSGQGSIELNKYSPNEVSYRSSSSSEQFAVFSEIYYQGSSKDWQAYIDNEPVDHIRVNYVLRGMYLPAGDHEIRFEFKPRSYYAGNKISLIFSIILSVIIAFSIFKWYRNFKSSTANQ